MRSRSSTRRSGGAQKGSNNFARPSCDDLLFRWFPARWRRARFLFEPPQRAQNARSFYGSEQDHDEGDDCPLIRAEIGPTHGGYDSTPIAPRACAWSVRKTRWSTLRQGSLRLDPLRRLRPPLRREPREVRAEVGAPSRRLVVRRHFLTSPQRYLPQRPRCPFHACAANGRSKSVAAPDAQPRHRSRNLVEWRVRLGAPVKATCR